MNREIKFRAWDGEKMNTDICLDNSDGVVFQFIASIPVKIVERLDWKLMQYTNLKDKNGKEIYEGDIVECTDWNKDRGQHHIGVAAFGIDVPCSAGFDFGSSGWSKEEIEIIGNIYENPELLKD